MPKDIRSAKNSRLDQADCRIAATHGANASSGSASFRLPVNHPPEGQGSHSNYDQGIGRCHQIGPNSNYSQPRQVYQNGEVNFHWPWPWESLLSFLMGLPSQAVPSSAPPALSAHRRWPPARSWLPSAQPRLIWPVPDCPCIPIPSRYKPHIRPAQRQ